MTVPVPIAAIPDTRPRSVTVTAVATGRDVRLPRCVVDFAPGHVLVPAWLYRRLAVHLGPPANPTRRKERKAS